VNNHPPLSEPDEPISPRKRGFYKPKNQLDGFLRQMIGGKYKHQRYKIFKDCLIFQEQKTPEEADKIISNFQANGINLNVYGLLEGVIHKWRKSRLTVRALKGSDARWEAKREKERNPKNK
jgi:hypothetical protein